MILTGKELSKEEFSQLELILNLIYLYLEFV